MEHNRHQTIYRTKSDHICSFLTVSPYEWTYYLEGVVDGRAGDYPSDNERCKVWYLMGHPVMYATLGESLLFITFTQAFTKRRTDGSYEWSSVLRF